VFDIPERKRKPDVQHHGQANDLRAGFEITKWVGFCHPAKLRNRPASLKPVLSDSASAGHPGSASAPLNGKVRDETGDLLTPTHTRRNGKQQRYYISNRLVSGGTDPTAWRLPAQKFEEAVTMTVCGHLRGHAVRHTVLSASDAATSAAASKAIDDLAIKLQSGEARTASSLISSITI
ncbi:unnamed protein product, partial [Ectocarpus sp. 12 AP-2014]